MNGKHEMILPFVQSTKQFKEKRRVKERVGDHLLAKGKTSYTMDLHRQIDVTHAAIISAGKYGE